MVRVVSIVEMIELLSAVTVENSSWDVPHVSVVNVLTVGRRGRRLHLTLLDAASGPITPSKSINVAVCCTLQSLSPKGVLSDKIYIEYSKLTVHPAAWSLVTRGAVALIGADLFPSQPTSERENTGTVLSTYLEGSLLVTKGAPT